MRAKKIFLVAVLIIVLYITGSCLYLRPRYVVPILMYHRIDAKGKLSSLSVAPENFRAQMRFLARHNYNVISLGDFVQAKKNQQRLPRNTVVITFDDGYGDNYIVAYPILKKYNIPATIFLIVGSINQQDYLSYEQIREMAACDLITFGSHSLGGDYLPGKTKWQLEEEIGLSKKMLEAWLDKDVEFFCYPIGGFTPEIQTIVGRYGYLAACATNRGKVQTCFNDDIFALKRIKIKDSFPNLFVFWVKLSGYYNFFRKIKAPH